VYHKHEQKHEVEARAMQKTVAKLTPLSALALKKKENARMQRRQEKKNKKPCVPCALALK